jgi:transposase
VDIMHDRGRKNPNLHADGEFARDEDGDGFCEVHVNTVEGFWSLLRSWLRPHRGISQERLPLYLGFFEFVHNVRRRGKALLGVWSNFW